jgi:hypothetical protein
MSARKTHYWSSKPAPGELDQHLADAYEWGRVNGWVRESSWSIDPYRAVPGKVCVTFVEPEEVAL